MVFYLSLAFALYLTGTLVTFVFLRTIGYAVSYPGVIWPPAWQHFTEIRSTFFLEKYQRSTAAGDARQAFMSLSTAYSLNPQNYDAGLLLARLSEITNPGFSDQIHQRLLIDHPDRAAATAQIWFRALLVRCDFKTIESLAASRILASPGQAGAWVNALLFANLRTGNNAMLTPLLESQGLPDGIRDLLALHVELRLLPPAAIPPRLVAAAQNTTHPLSFFLICRRLIQSGQAQEVLSLMETRSRLLGPRDLTALRLDALAALGWTTLLRTEIESLLIARPSSPVVELLATHLLRHPNPDLLGLSFDRLAKEPLPHTSENYPASLALFCAAGIGRDPIRLDWAATQVRAIAHSSFRGLDAIKTIFLEGDTPRIQSQLPALRQLPLETIYALLDRIYSPPSPRPSPPVQ